VNGFSRRKFLGMSAATAGATMFTSLPLILRQALAAPAAGGSLSSVRHVVVLTQENRSFDHYFGGLNGVRGFGDRSALLLRNGNPVFKQPNQSGHQFPFRLDTSTSSAQCVDDLDHSWRGTHKACNNGRQDQWLEAKGSLTMGYFSRADLPFHYALADAFTICDHYHCSVMAPTHPNRLYLMSGMLDPRGSGGGPVTNNGEPGFSWTTYPERLQSAGVSWKVYQNADDNYDDNALAWFSQYQDADPGTPLHDRGISSVPSVSGSTVADIAAAIRSDVVEGRLPQVSWIVGPAACSEHPNYGPANGADFIGRVLGALTADPAVWASTVLFVNYDENDGYFDHLQAPLPPPGTLDEFVDGLPIGLGPRVPMLVVSPWSRGGYVCSQVFDHTSVIRFVETWTGVREPNISAWRRQVCGDLTAAFDFGNSMIAIPALPDTARLMAEAVEQCATLPSPTLPATSSMPNQESGTRPARPLPYQPNATSRADADGAFRIKMSNGGADSVHYAIHPNHHRSDGPWQYDVAANGSIEDKFRVEAEDGGKYDLSAYGPNGFLRRFIGKLDAAGGQFEVVSSYDLSSPTAGKLLLEMSNNGSNAVIFTVRSNAYRGDGPWTYTVAPGQTVSDYWDIQLKTDCWYDLTASVDIDSLFSRRFAGHLETGLPSVTG